MYEVSYSFLFISEKIVVTIPSSKCDISYGQYDDMEIAKFACTLDVKCLSIVDDACDQVGPFYACGKQYPNREGINSACETLPVKEERKYLVLKIHDISGYNI